jgi:hypothetical protein
MVCSVALAGIAIDLFEFDFGLSLNNGEGDEIIADVRVVGRRDEYARVVDSHVGPRRWEFSCALLFPASFS